MDGLGSVNVTRQLSDYFQTGSLVVDLLIGLVISQLVMAVLNRNMITWIYEKLTARRTPYAMTTIIKYDPKEPNVNNIRYHSEVAFEIFHEFFCHVAESDRALQNARLVIHHKDECSIVSKWDMKDARLRIMPVTEIKYKGMLIRFGTSQASDQTNNKKKRIDDDDKKESEKSGLPIYDIEICHNTREEVDALYSEIHEYTTKKYVEISIAEETRITFRYYDSDDDFREYRSSVQPVTFQSILLPEAQKRLLEKNLFDFRNRQGCFSAGNPHRLVFLIHGPPGGGKTSFIRMLISYFQVKQVNVIPSLGVFKNDSELRGMFHGHNNFEKKRLVKDDEASEDTTYIPPKMFVLEEIDAGDTNHVLQDRKVKRELEQTLSSNNPEKVLSMMNARGGGLTLSGWLDMFDGLMEMENKVIVMSTNHLEYLDPAVYRKRRVTQVIDFKPATQVELRTFCQQRFGRAPKHVPDAFESKYSDMIDAYYQSDGNLDRFMKIIS